MDSTLMISGAIFLGISATVWAVLSMFTEKDSRASERLQELKDGGRKPVQENKGGVGGAVSAAAPALSKMLAPKTELEQSELKVRLANAGYGSPAASTLFLATKTIFLCIGLFFGGIVGVWRSGLTLTAAQALFMGGGLGFYLPEIFVRIKASGRKGRIFLSMPDAL